MRDALAPELPWLPQRLRDAGFETVAFSAMIQVSKLAGFDRGFDAFGDVFRDPEIARRCAERGQAARDPSFCLPLSEDLHERALRWLDARRVARPFFMFVWSIDTHEPFRQPARCNVDVDPGYRGAIDGRGRPFSQARNASDRQQVIDLYDGALRYQDEQLGKLVAELERRGVLDDTLLIVIGDHGEMFWEHGLAGHGKFPWEEELRVPCVMRAPREIRGGTRSDALASNADLAPTIAELLDLPREPRSDGASLVPCLRDSSERVHDALTIEVPMPFDRRELARVVRRGRWKLVEATPPSAGRRARRVAKETGRALASLARPATIPFVYGQRDPSLRRAGAWLAGQRIVRLYDLDADPRERRDVSRDEPQIVAELLATIGEVSTRATPLAGDDDEARRIAAQLAELGYVDE
jgi:arylsulfatase A-like enzyme